jgi:hypothetical protein
MHSTGTAIGRIIAASLSTLRIECFELEGAPPLGSLVAVAEDTPVVYGVVSSVTTEGVDPSRPVSPHGSADEDLATVLSRNPQLPVLLRTTFEAIVVGHEDSGCVRHYLAGAPARLIARIRICGADEQLRFAESLDFLEPLLGSGALADDVVAAFIRRTSLAQSDPYAFLLAAARALVPLLMNEPDRLTAIIRRIRPRGI